MVVNSFLMDTGEANLTSPTFLDRALLTGAYSTENLSPAKSLSAGIPVVLLP